MLTYLARPPWLSIVCPVCFLRMGSIERYVRSKTKKGGGVVLGTCKKSIELGGVLVVNRTQLN